MVKYTISKMVVWTEKRVTEKDFAVYGKVHGPYMATDFRRLQASVGGPVTEEFANNKLPCPPVSAVSLGHSHNKQVWPRFYQEITPPDSPAFGFLAAWRGPVTIQSYRQSEGQLAKRLQNTPINDRPFVQTTVIEITPDRIKELYQQGLAVYPGLLKVPTTGDGVFTKMARHDSPKAKILLSSLADPERPENRLLLGEKWLPMITRAFRILLTEENSYLVIETSDEVTTATKVQIAHTLTYLLMAYPNKQPLSFVTEPVVDFSGLRLIFTKPGEKIPPLLETSLKSRGVVRHDLRTDQLISLTDQERKIKGRLKYLSKLSLDQLHSLWQSSFANEVLNNDLF